MTSFIKGLLSGIIMTAVIIIAATYAFVSSPNNLGLLYHWNIGDHSPHILNPYHTFLNSDQLIGTRNSGILFTDPDNPNSDDLNSSDTEIGNTDALPNDTFFSLAKHTDLLTLTRQDFENVCTRYIETPGIANDEAIIDFTLKDAALSRLKTTLETLDRTAVQLIDPVGFIRLTAIPTAWKQTDKNTPHISLAFGEADFAILASELPYWNDSPDKIAICTEGKNDVKDAKDLRQRIDIYGWSRQNQ